jgi:acetyltransferase-like isoleucine patch superfamily enzyme
MPAHSNPSPELAASPAVSARLAGPACRLASALRVMLARLSGARVGAGVFIGPRCEVALGRPPARRGSVIFGDRNRLESGVIIHSFGGRVETGIDVFLGPYVVIYGHGGVEIGKDTLVSMHCRILSSNHTVPPPGTIIRSKPDELRPTRIGRDVWLGAGVTVLGGVTIGDACVVGAGAVVTHDLPPTTIAVGVPARAVGRRGEAAGSRRAASGA